VGAKETVISAAPWVGFLWPGENFTSFHVVIITYAFVRLCKNKQVKFLSKCNFSTMIVSTNDERCLIHNLHFQKHLGSERIMKKIANK